MKLDAKSLDLSALRLRGEMLLWRLGWLPVVAAALLVVAVLCLALVLPVQRLRVEALENELAAAVEQSASKVAVAPQEPPLNAFQRLLMPQAQTNDLLRQIHQIAQNAGVVTVQADLRRVNDNAGVASQLQIALPARGDYAALRRFCLTLLSAIPSLSLDQLVLKREQVQNNQVDAQIILSVWQTPERRVVAAGGQP